MFPNSPDGKDELTAFFGIVRRDDKCACENGTPRDHCGHFYCVNCKTCDAGFSEGHNIQGMVCVDESEVTISPDSDYCDEMGCPGAKCQLDGAEAKKCVDKKKLKEDTPDPPPEPPVKPEELSPGEVVRGSLCLYP